MSMRSWTAARFDSPATGSMSVVPRAEALSDRSAVHAPRDPQRSGTRLAYGDMADAGGLRTLPCAAAHHGIRSVDRGDRTDLPPTPAQRGPEGQRSPAFRAEHIPRPLESPPALESRLRRQRPIASAPSWHGPLFSRITPIYFRSAPTAICGSQPRLANCSGQYACDLLHPAGTFAKIDAQGTISTATKVRITGFGGARNMRRPTRVGLRHDSPPGLRRPCQESVARTIAASEPALGVKGATLQLMGSPSVVEHLDAFDLVSLPRAFSLPPVMSYATTSTHVVPNRRRQLLCACRFPTQDAKAALLAIGRRHRFRQSASPETGDSLRAAAGDVFAPPPRHRIHTPATRDWLAAQRIDDLRDRRLADSTAGRRNPPDHCPPLFRRGGHLMTREPANSSGLPTRNHAPVDRVKQLAAITACPERGTRRLARSRAAVTCTTVATRPRS